MSCIFLKTRKAINHIIYGGKIILKTGESISPDLIDYDDKLVYEIHVKGVRKDKYFDQLPNGWRGINVFYDEEDNPETLIIKLGTWEIERIKWKMNTYLIICDFEHARLYVERRGGRNRKKYDANFSPRKGKKNNQNNPGISNNW